MYRKYATSMNIINKKKISEPKSPKLKRKDIASHSMTEMKTVMAKIKEE